MPEITDAMVELYGSTFLKALTFAEASRASAQTAWLLADAEARFVTSTKHDIHPIVVQDVAYEFFRRNSYLAHEAYEFFSRGSHPANEAEVPPGELPAFARYIMGGDPRHVVK